MAARRVLAAAAALFVLLALAPLATAHAVLESSVPTKGARLDEPPSFVSVTLTEPADPDGSSLEVHDAAGMRVDLGDLTFSGGSHPTLRVSLPPDLADGAYSMQWQALSGADGHTTRGLVGFAVGDFTPPGSTESDPQQVAWLGAAGRFLAFAGLSLALGAGVFLAWVPGAAAVPRRPVLEALLLGAGVHLLGVALLFQSTLQQTGLTSTGLAATAVGKALLLRLGLGLGALAFAAIAAAPRVPARAPPHVAVAMLAVAALGSARFGHASLAGGAGIAVDAMHLLAGATWVGGLAVFLWLLGEARRGRWHPDQVRLAGVRFGTIALVCVIALLAAGLGATLAILGPAAWRDPGAVLSSAWGRALAAKVGLSLLMVALGAVNRYGILEPAAQGGLSAWLQRGVTRVWPDLRVLDGGAEAMRRLVRVEALLGAAVLALAAVLTSVSPPVQAAHGATAFESTGFGDEFHGVLAASPWPAVGGTSRLVVRVETHGGTPVEGNTCGREPPLSCVSAAIGGKAGDGGEVHALQPIGGGDWAVDGILWTVAGDVVVTVTVSTSMVFADDLAFTVAVRPNA